ncbi:MAG: tyrosine-type recombinase/integrase [Candidatus Thermoplasmatota archaeon]|nr:tyrosine-type recombinase/integrase [Candidatus Thermoplasmatota archaeon]
MNEEILEKYRQYLRREYSKQNTRDNYYKFIQYFLEWLWDTRHKRYDELIPDDTKEYKAFCLQHYKTNGNVGRLNSINNFVDNFLHRKELRVSVPNSVYVNKQVLSHEELEQYKNAADTSLEKLVVTYQIDGLLRPSEFFKLMIFLHDCKNQILYLDDTKTGNNHVILTPHMINAFEEYKRCRIPPKRKEDKDKLLIIDKGSHYGLAPSPNSDFVYRVAKRIAARAGFKRSVYPYLIKPSVITDGFNQNVNPKILQRQARHRKIETTLRYDHTTDKMVKDYFNSTQRQPDIDALNPNDKAKVWLDKMLSGEIDLKTFKSGLDVLLPQNRHGGDDVAYL